MSEHDARFWDRAAKKYAASPIDDEAGFERTLARTRALMPPEARVLELGCGTGTAALCLADSVKSYVGTDISAGMIAIAQEKLETARESGLNATLAVTVKVSVALSDFYAAICTASVIAFRSGFNDTNAPGSQLRVSPLQRSGCAALAARLSAWRFASMALSSPVWRCIGVTKRIAL
jgi:SAM-dependent methyltransferase